MADLGVFAASLVEAGAGRAVIVFGRGFAGSSAHQALAQKFRVIVASDSALAPRALGEAAAAWAADQGLESVGFVGVGEAAAAALWAASAAGERANAVVLAAPVGLPVRDDADDPDGLRPLLTAIAAPKAVLLGTVDRTAPPDAAERFRKALSKCNVVLVFGAGQDIVGERPGAFANVAGDFLDRQARFAFMTESLALDPG